MIKLISSLGYHYHVHSFRDLLKDGEVGFAYQHTQKIMGFNWIYQWTN